jgi:hypothetical protein
LVAKKVAVLRFVTFKGPRRTTVWQLLVAMTLTMGMSQNPPKLNIGLLEELCNAFGPSGFEREVQQIIRDRGQPFADEVLFDGTGSVIFKKVGTSNDTCGVL